MIFKGNILYVGSMYYQSAPVRWLRLRRGRMLKMNLSADAEMAPKVVSLHLALLLWAFEMLGSPNVDISVWRNGIFLPKSIADAGNEAKKKNDGEN